jgi:glycosidase
MDTLKVGLVFGVDGFRCDVASLLPEEFWVEARKAVASVKPGVIWLAESVHARFVEYRRQKNLSTISDSEVYRGFDLTYDYDIFAIWQAAVGGNVPVARYLELLRFQDAIYPANYAKMRYVENHDQMRIMKAASNYNQALAWTAFEAFNKGAFLIYGGQESAAFNTPSLFDIDKVDWKDYRLAAFLTTLAKLKKDPAQEKGQYTITHAAPVVQAVWENPGANLLGIFNLEGYSGEVEINLPDGKYIDLLSNNELDVTNGKVIAPDTAMILRVAGTLKHIRPFYSELMDFDLVK